MSTNTVLGGYFGTVQFTRFDVHETIIFNVFIAYSRQKIILFQNRCVPRASNIIVEGIMGCWRTNL
jgi:hypothetical protein